jgi:hypothetical protein
MKFSRMTPFAFTEHGAVMPATVRNSPRAVQVSVVWRMRAFYRAKTDIALSGLDKGYHI